MQPKPPNDDRGAAPASASLRAEAGHPIDLDPVLGGARLRAVAEELGTITLAVQARDGRGYGLRLAGARVARRSPGWCLAPEGAPIAWWLVAGNQLLLVLADGHFITLQAEALELEEEGVSLCERTVG